MWNQNYDTNELIHETDSQAQRTDLWLPRRRGVGGMNWELGIQFSSVAQSCPTLCDSMDCSMPGFPVHHQLHCSHHTRATAIFHLEYCNDGGFPAFAVVKNRPANAGDVGLIPGSGRPPGERSGYSLQYSCLENPMDRGAWLSMESQRWTRLSD